jgi:1,4-dihydroxy-2-naphthoate octaprenyltransferase
MASLLRVARPQFLIASLALYIIGASWAILLGSPYSLPRLLLGYLIILPAHLSISYSNDYFDVEVDKFGKPSLFSGGSGILIERPELRQPALWTALALIFTSLALGIFFLLKYSLPVWFLGYIAVSNLLGWFYSAPPLRLAYRGWGELLTAFTAGCLIPGMGYLVTRGFLDRNGLLFAVPLTLYGLAFILTVEIPDEEADRLGNKKTWVVRKGRVFGFTAVLLLLLAATGFFFSVPYLPYHAARLDFRVLGLLSLLPLGAGVLGMVKRPVDKQAATRLVNGMIVTFAVFFILTDIYLVTAVVH